MDFSNRGPQMQTPAPNIPTQNTHSANTNRKKGSRWSQGKFYRLAQVILMYCVVIVIIGLLGVIAFGKNTDESHYIQTDKLQAVFLNTGQVYFGNIKSLNNQYLILENIFYLQTNSSSGSSTSSSSTTNANDVTLVKLGCEIHAPLDQMVINESQVTFWENLSPSGQVAKAVATYWRDNPDGQKCSDQSTAGTSGQSTPQSATNK